jgi:hypothetical protein
MHQNISVPHGLAWQGDVLRLTEQPSTSASSAAPADTASPVADGADRAVSDSLRTAYQKTVEEPVPDDLLDLLGKLD